MVLEQEIKYKVCDEVRYTQSEEAKIINLLKDVRRSVAILKPVLSNHRLDTILEVIERGNWIIQDKVNPKEPLVALNYNVDLSEAKNLVGQYRQHSEGGCQSCKAIRHYMPFQGDYFKYCSKVEDEEFAKSNWSNHNSASSTIRKFYPTGCDDKEPIHKRKLEEVLKDHKNE
jgi:hypothetical protein